ncbi:hypothetical protein SK128_023981 [Halocaridina rubra]|uniref:Pyrroline-5-carboxylate reductase catalytic N-terminal domain-containing protein n=1 Tax=Halocaridina rubra TaxID=373956 RepID=A0AAN8WW91_HALRR
MAGQSIPKWLVQAFQNGWEKHSKMAGQSIPKWLGKAFQNGWAKHSTSLWMDNMSFDRDGLDPVTVNGSKTPIRHHQQSPSQTIAVLGSGDYGRAIARRFVNIGYTVNIGSRDPNRSKVKYV